MVDEKHHRAKLICNGGGRVEELDVVSSALLSGYMAGAQSLATSFWWAQFN